MKISDPLNLILFWKKMLNHLKFFQGLIDLVLCNIERNSSKFLITLNITILPVWTNS